MNNNIDVFKESLINMDAADSTWRSPFIKGEDLDINNEELVNELTEYAFHAPVPQKED